MRYIFLLPLISCTLPATKAYVEQTRAHIRKFEDNHIKNMQTKANDCELLVSKEEDKIEEFNTCMHSTEERSKSLAAKVRHLKDDIKLLSAAGLEKDSGKINKLKLEIEKEMVELK